MYVHGSTCLEGPRSRSRHWWAAAEDAGGAVTADPDIRSDLVERVRREIAAGVYDTPEKMELALERLMSSLDWA